MDSKVSMDFEKLLEALASEFKNTDMVLGALLMFGKTSYSILTDESKESYLNAVIRTTVYREIGNSLNVGKTLIGLGVPDYIIANKVEGIRAELTKHAEDKLNGNSH